MAQRWALPPDVNREKATNDAIAYSCKKIGHFIVHIFCITDFQNLYYPCLCKPNFGPKKHSGCRATARSSCIRRTVECDAGSLQKGEKKLNPTPSVTGTQSDASDGCFRCLYYAFLATLSALLIKVRKLLQSFISLVPVDSCTEGNIKVMDYVMVIKCPRLSVFAQS